MKKTSWSILNKSLTTLQMKLNHIDVLTINGKNITNERQICNELNNLYAQIGLKLDKLTRLRCQKYIRL